jgi:hypothetical protein
LTFVPLVWIAVLGAHLVGIAGAGRFVVELKEPSSDPAS